MCLHKAEFIFKEEPDMLKHLYLLALTFVLCVSFAVPPAFSQDATLTLKTPLKVDVKERSVSVLAQVNGKYLVQPTRHGVVFKEGKNGDKSVFVAFADPQTFYESLVKLGFKAGNNMTWDNKEKTSVEGDILDVSVTWKGAKRVYSMDEAIKDSNGKPLMIRFGGNLATALDKKTGCLMCLDSCPVGITTPPIPMGRSR
jgi:hypothetical protein